MKWFKRLAAPALGVAFILAGVFASPVTIVADKLPPVPVKLTQADIDRDIDLLAPKYGLNASLVKRISQCEDQGNPYNTNANKRSGVVWSTDIGPLQINDYYHESEMKALALDIHDPLENLSFGMDMMSKQGTTPWNWSKGCWNK